jgi:hypothetical protein
MPASGLPRRHRKRAEQWRKEQVTELEQTTFDEPTIPSPRTTDLPTLVKAA